MAEEKRFEIKVKKFLDQFGCWYVKYWGGGEFTKAGVPDLLCCVGGKFIAVELKGASGRPSDLQLRTLKKIEDAGGISCLLYPKDFPVWKAWIEDLLMDVTIHDEIDTPFVSNWHKEYRKRGIGNAGKEEE